MLSLQVAKSQNKDIPPQKPQKAEWPGCNTTPVCRLDLKVAAPELQAYLLELYSSAVLSGKRSVGIQCNNRPQEKGKASYHPLSGKITDMEHK